MNGVEVLMDRFWVVKEQDRDLFFKLRRELAGAERFARDYPGWRLVSNERLIKLEKIPAHAEPFMGIGEFTEKSDYAFFCALLIFLEDLEDGEAFLLSELVDRIEIQLKEKMDTDWTKFTLRKSLIRALRAAERFFLIVVHEGNIDAFSGGTEQEVLYENTGLSRYFAVNYGRDMSALRSWQDYESHTIQETDTDRGHFRINRVYRTLLTCPAMYWETAEDADSLYLKNQRQWVSRYLTENLEGRLDIHRNAAFFVQEERESFGEVFPRDTTICDMVLLYCAALRVEVQENGEFRRMPDDTVLAPEEAGKVLWERVAQDFSPAWSKEYREMPEKRRWEELTACMRDWRMLDTKGEDLVFYPAAFKMAGSYPPDVDVSAWAQSGGEDVVTQAGPDAESPETTVDEEPAANRSASDAEEASRRKQPAAGKRGRKRQQEKTGAEDGQMSLFV